MKFAEVVEQGLHNHLTIGSLLFLILSSIFLLHYAISGQAVYGDGIGYYAHLHSWYFDFDADFSNEYLHIYGAENNNRFEPAVAEQVQIVATNSRGEALNHFPPGMALLLFPFYILIDILGSVLVATGFEIALNGYSDLYQIGMGLTAIGYVLGGLYFGERLLQELSFSKKIRWTALATLLFATNLIYYGSYDVINSHFAAFFLVNLFGWYFFSMRKHGGLGIKEYAAVGLVVGLMALTRPQDGVIALVVLLDGVRQRVGFIRMIVFAGAILMLILPLLWQWYGTFESFDTHPYFMWLTGAERHASWGELWGVLFHLRNGLLSRTPLLLAALGMFGYLMKRKKISYELKFLAIFFVLEYFIIVGQSGWKAAAYGGRLFITAYPFFLILLAELIAWARERFSFRKIWIVVTAYIILNAVSIASFILFEKEASNFGSGLEATTVIKLQKIFKN